MITHEGWIKAIDAEISSRYVTPDASSKLDLDTSEGGGQIWLMYDDISKEWLHFYPVPGLVVFRIPDMT
jgi:hypothetical protein